MSNNNSWIERSENLARILDVECSIKEHMVDDSRRLLAAHIILMLDLLDERHANFGNMRRVLLPSLGKMVSTIDNIKQSKRIVDTSDKHI